MVGEIGRIDASLDSTPFVSEREGARQREIEREQARTFNRIASCISESSRNGNRKGARIEEQALASTERSASRLSSAAANRTGARGIRLVTLDARRERQTGLRRD